MAATRANTSVDTNNASVTRRAVRAHSTPGTQYRAPGDPQLAPLERPAPRRQVHHARQPTHGPTVLLLASNDTNHRDRDRVACGGAARVRRSGAKANVLLSCCNLNAHNVTSGVRCSPSLERVQTHSTASDLGRACNCACSAQVCTPAAYNTGACNPAHCQH